MFTRSGTRFLHSHSEKFIWLLGKAVVSPKIYGVMVLNFWKQAKVVNDERGESGNEFLFEVSSFIIKTTLFYVVFEKY